MADKHPASRYDATMENSLGQSLDTLLRQARLRIDPVDAEWLLAHALGRPRSWVYAHGDDVIDPASRARYETLVERRAAGEPVAYLTGTRGFWTLELQVTPDTLIPRVETELLVELALARLPKDSAWCVADLGTGSGAVALALASERPLARVLATDASAQALVVARNNADAAGVRNVTFSSGDWCRALGDERFDLIVSNPPYLATDDPHRGIGDLRFEPESALYSGIDGLDAIRTIVRDSRAHLLPGGWLLLEHGCDQGGAVRDLLHAAGFEKVATQRDLEQRERVSLGRAWR
ncbi:MAG: prmC [Xanthomonadaceae bacterium]|nr:prmC [Xanthomonadaceae bacterium]